MAEQDEGFVVRTWWPSGLRQARVSELMVLSGGVL